MTAVASALALALLLLLAAEKAALRLARRRLRHVVHVNGTRGKSNRKSVV